MSKNKAPGTGLNLAGDKPDYLPEDTTHTFGEGLESAHERKMAAVADDVKASLSPEKASVAEPAGPAGPVFTCIAHRDKTLCLGKSFDLRDMTDDTSLIKDYGPHLYDGVARRITLDSEKPFQQLADIKRKLGKHEALVGGVYAYSYPADELELGTRRNRPENGIARTKEDLPWRWRGAGLMTIDCDGGASDRIPEPNAPRSRGELKKLLKKYAPELLDGYVLLESSSAGLTNSYTGNTLYPEDRWHFYTLVKDAHDIPRSMEALHMRMVIGGDYWVFITGSGIPRVRTVVDQMLRVPAQPIFGTPHLKSEHLCRRVPPPDVKEGPLLDTRKAIPELTDDDRQRFTAASGEAVTQAKVNHAVLIARLIDEQGTRIAGNSGISKEAALEMLHAAKDETLYLWGRQPVLLDDGRWLSANDILAKCTRYHNVGCADPAEPDYGRGKAIIYTDDNPYPVVHSLAHGISQTYILKFDADGYLDHLRSMTPDQVKDRWERMLLDRLYDDGAGAEIARVKEGLVDMLGVGKRELNKMVTNAQRKEADRQRKEQQLRRRQELQASATAPILEYRWFPSKEAEIVDDIREHITSLNQDDPVLQRFGHLVLVREGPPDRVSYTKGDPPKAIPPIMRLVPLNLNSMRLELNRRTIALNKEGELVGVPFRLPGLLLDDVKVGTVPEVTGVLEHPIILPSGEVLTRNGFHKDTGLYLRMNESLDRLPDDVSQKKAQGAMSFLREKVFQDFPFASDLDRDVAVGGLLTANQAPILEQCPGFMVSGADRNVGKTELACSIYLALTGRNIPVNALAGGEEELAKVIGSILLEGQTIVLFDNLKDGAPLRSEQLAALITTKGEFKTRILGKSKQVTGSARVFVIVTGVNVRTTGDLNSRLLPCRLEENEQNRVTEYARGDMLKWFREYRPVIWRAIVAIIAGYIKAGAPRPDAIDPMTGRVVIDEATGKSRKAEHSRFRTWDELVRFPILWAGGYDIADGFTRNVDDDEAADLDYRTLAALYAWQEAALIGDKGWWANDVTDWCRPSLSGQGLEVPESIYINATTDTYNKPKSHVAAFLQRHKKHVENQNRVARAVRKVVREKAEADGVSQRKAEALAKERTPEWDEETARKDRDQRAEDIQAGLAELVEALKERFAGDSKAVSTAKLGYRLRGLDAREVGEYKICRLTKSMGRVRWRVERRD